MFQLTKSEITNLRCHFSTSSWGGSSVQLRHYVLAESDTNKQIAELRKLLMLYIEKNDKRVNDIIIALNNLIAQPPKIKKIGFNTSD